MRTQKVSRVSALKYAKHHENSLLMINPSLPKHGMRFKRANTALAPSSASQIQRSAPDTLPKCFLLESVFAVTNCMLRTSWNLIVPEGIVKSWFLTAAIVEILKLFPLVPSSVAAKASARYSSSRCTQCVPCGGASQRAAQWSAVHCVLSRQLTSAAASSSRFRRSSLSEDLFTSCSWVEKENHCWWYSWWGLTSLMEKKGGLRAGRAYMSIPPKSMMNFWFVEFFWILPRFMNQISTGTMPGIFRCNVKWCSAIFRRHFVEHLPELSTCPTATFQTSWFDWGLKYLAQSINGR